MKNKKLNTWIDQFQAVNKLMEDQLDKWNSIEEIRKTYDEFINNLKKLKDMQPDLDKDLAPVTNELEEKRKHLVSKIFPLVNILAVYVSDKNLKKGTRSIIIGREKLHKLKNGKLLDFAEQMQKNMEKYAPDPGQPDGELSRYGMTPIMADEFNTSHTKYAHALHLSKDLLRNRSRLKKLANRLLKANRKLLENRLDRLMTVFSVTHPSFYQDYAGIRRSRDERGEQDG